MCSTPPASARAAVAAPGPRQPGQDRRGPADRQPLVADLRRGGDRDLADPLWRQRRVAPQQFPDDPYYQVIGAGLRVDALGSRLAERRPHAVDEHHVTRPHRLLLKMRTRPAGPLRAVMLLDSN